MISYAQSAADILIGKCRLINIDSLHIREGEDATAPLLNIFKSLDPDVSYKIIFSNKRYDFYPGKAMERYCSISNNNNGLKRIAFPVLGLKNIEIDGNGAQFIFHGLIMPFDIEGSENIKVNDLSINWAEPLVLESRIVANDTVKKSIDIRIPDGIDYAVREKQLIYKSITGENTFKGTFIFDPATKRPAYHTAEYYLDGNKATGAREISKNVIRLFNIGHVVPPVGFVVVDDEGRYVKGVKGRLIPAIRIAGSKNLELRHVTVYHSGAMGLVAEKSENIRLVAFKVILPPHAAQLVTTTSDATHFVNCKGTINFDSCVFENMMDDGTNVHGIYETVDSMAGDSSMYVKLNHYLQYGFVFAGPGDSVRFIDRNTMMPVLSEKVVSFELVNEQYAILRVGKNICGRLPQKAAVENISWQPDVVMKHCIIGRNRARSVLISTAGKVVIENNYFSPQMSAINISGDVNYWFESGPVSNVLIRDNTFVDVGIDGGRPYPVLLINPQIDPKYLNAGYYHRNITFENNIIRTFDSPIISAVSTSGLKILNNKIVRTTSLKPLFPDHPAFQFTYCKNLIIQGNQYDDINGGSATVLLKDCLTPSVKVRNNKEFKMKDSL